MEDLNYLYMRQQVALMAADSAACSSSRSAHHALARAYGRRITVVRAAGLAPAQAAAF